MEGTTYAKQRKKSSLFWKRDIDLRPVCASSGKLRGGFLGLVVAATVLGTTPIAMAGCAEQEIESELAEPKALTRAGLRTQFRDFVLREFPVGSDGGRLLRWLERSGFSAPEISYYRKLSVSAEESLREEALADDRVRKGTPLQLSIRSFGGLCGQNLYAVYWRLGSCNRIVELYTDEERCRLDLP